MKRNVDLIRAILIDLEGEQEISLSEYTEDQIKYHKALVIEAGFAVGKVIRAFVNSDYIPTDVRLDRLTYEGHDFLDNARNDTIWNSAKKLIKDKGATVTIEALKIAMNQTVTKLLLSQ